MWKQVIRIGLLVLMIAVTGSVLAQSSTPEATEMPAAPSLVGSTWQWLHFADGAQEMGVLKPNYTITFTEDGKFSARADCNSVAGTYTADASTITIKPGPTTLVACLPGSLGDQFTRYLSQVATYSFSDAGDLLLEIPADSGTLTLSAQPILTGTVTYRERMALPPDAVVRVQLQDVSVADAPSLLLGEQVIVTNGAQVPIPFMVSYPASAIQDGHRYSVSARISDGQGNLLFITDTNVPVITDGSPTSDIQLNLVRVSS
ncbi:MAG TPA: YbaY family lipoprotein [Phototrophicaceae bacterium]|nr:YbaY family lipoprotein [Phototrophicaceae bacterium]